MEKRTPMADRLKCPYCRRKFKSSTGRSLHIQKKHPDRSTGIFYGGAPW